MDIKGWSMCQAKWTQEKIKWRHVTQETVVSNKAAKSVIGAVTAVNVPMIFYAISRK